MFVLFVKSQGIGLLKRLVTLIALVWSDIIVDPQMSSVITGKIKLLLTNFALKFFTFAVRDEVT